MRIGRSCSIGAGCFYPAHQGGVIIGDDCLISPNVTIIVQQLQLPAARCADPAAGDAQSRGVRIGNNVWIGSGACILDGAQVGSGVIVAPNSVVSGRIPDNAIVQGNPAKVIFTRR